MEKFKVLTMKDSNGLDAHLVVAESMTAEIIVNGADVDDQNDNLSHDYSCTCFSLEGAELIADLLNKHFHPQH